MKASWLAVGLMSLALTTTALASEKPIVLRLATNHPLTHVGTTAGSQFFIKNVEDQTNGKIKFQFYPAEQLAKIKDMVNVVSSGRADMTYVLSGIASGELPMSTVAELPGLFSDPKIAVKAFRKLVQNRLTDQEIKRHGIVPLIPIVWSQTLLFTTKPVKSLQDMKGLKIAVSGNVQVEAIKALGATPVLIPITEAYEAIQRGVVHGTLGMFNNASAYKIQEVAKYAVEGVGMGGYAGYFPINEKSWKKIPDDVKAVMVKVGLETSDNVSRVSDEKEQAIMAQWKKEGMQIYHIPADQKQEWIGRLRMVQDTWVKDMSAKGHPAQKVLDEFKAALVEAGK